MSPIMSIPRPLDVVSAGGGFLWVLCVGGIFSIQPGACETTGLAGDFHRPYGGCVLLFIGVVLDEFDGEFVGEAGDDA